MKKFILMSGILTLCGLSALVCSCKDARVGQPHVAGILDGPLPADAAPARVLEAMAGAERFHQYEIMDDTLGSVSVWCIGEVDTTATEGYGIVVMKGTTSTTFPHIRNTRQPLARYDRTTDVLWLAGSAMEGTGVQVERLYQIRFSQNDSAYIAHVVEPYDLQQQLCQRLGYSIDGQQVTLYDGNRLIATATNSISDMGGFDEEQPLWIGEQMEYDLSGVAPRLLVTPGVKFTTGLVLTYDDMPMLCAPLSIGDDGKVSIGDLETAERPF